MLTDVATLIGMLTGKKGVILGVANKRSLAWAIAKACSTGGAELVMTYQGERFAQTAERLAERLPNPSTTVACDVTNPDDVAKLVAHVREHLGQVDFLVHSIAFANPEELRGRFRDTSGPGFKQALDISAYSLIPIAKEMAELMPDGGSILTLSYLGGERVVPNYNLMGVAKASLDAIVRYLAHDLGRENIRVNAIAPGPIRTLSASGVGDFSRMLDHVEKVAPLRRNVTTEEVGDVAAFLVSDLARGITGAHIPIDAGYSIMGVTTVADTPPKAAGDPSS